MQRLLLYTNACDKTWIKTFMFFMLCIRAAGSKRRETGSRCQAPSFRFRSAGSRCQVHTRCQVSGARSQVPSVRWQVPDSSCQGPGMLKMNFWLEITVTQNITKNHRRCTISHTANFSAITSHICEKAIKLKELWKYLFLIFKNMEWWLIDLGKY